MVAATSLDRSSSRYHHGALKAVAVAVQYRASCVVYSKQVRVAHPSLQNISVYPLIAPLLLCGL